MTPRSPIPVPEAAPSGRHIAPDAVLPGSGPASGSGLGPGLAEALRSALAEPPQRVRKIEVGGRRIWLKRVETLSFRMRLQKGDSRRSFEADRTGLHAMARAGLPVAPIIAEGADYFAMPDVGRPLSGLLVDPAEAGPARIAAFAAAGAALARIHRAGFSHGRPSIRDICWDGTAACFIDIERFSPRRNTPRGQTADVVMFLFSILAYARAEVPELRVAADAYRQSAPAGIWDATQRRARRLGWLGWLASQVLRLRPRSRELAAVPKVLAFIRDA